MALHCWESPLLLLIPPQTLFFVQNRTTLKIDTVASTEGQENVLASLGLRWWQHIFVKSLHKQCIHVVICESITVEVNVSRITLLCIQNSFFSVRPYHCLQTVQKTICGRNGDCKDQYQKFKRIAIYLNRLSFLRDQL